MMAPKNSDFHFLMFLFICCCVLVSASVRHFTPSQVSMNGSFVFIQQNRFHMAKRKQKRIRICFTVQKSRRETAEAGTDGKMKSTRAAESASYTDIQQNIGRNEQNIVRKSRGQAGISRIYAGTSRIQAGKIRIQAGRKRI